MSESIEKTFPVTTPARLVIENIRGAVEIRPGEDGSISVTAVKKASTGDEKRTEIEITQETDGTVTAATRFPDGGWNWMFGSQPCEVDYVVKAPRLCSLKVNGVSNSALVEGIEGETSLNSVSGEIQLNDMTGPLRIHTVSGDVEGRKLTGKLEVDTVSGDVTLKESNLSTIKSNSVSGDMQIATPLTEGPYGFKSVSGDVRLIVPPETHCTGELHSVSGDIVSAFPTSGFSRNHGSQSVIIQGGGVKVSMHSVSGDLSLDSNGEMPPAVKTINTISSEDRLTVLELVEKGEITVEEALGKLNP